MLVLEALRAKFGDALILHFGTKTKPLLAVIDGGPPGVYADAVKKRLLELRAERKLGPTQPLELELMMVTHIDADHVAGILQLAQEMKDRRDSHQPPLWKIRRFWHNAFDDLVGDDDPAIAGAASTVSTASLASPTGHAGSLLLASVPQGRDLRKTVDALNLDGNPPFGGLVRAGHDPIAIGNLEITVVAPSQKNLKALQTDWDKKIKPILKKEKKNTADFAEIADYVDKSVYNLASVVMLVESQGKRLLLTGDGRGDHTLSGLEDAGLMDGDGRIEVDVLKMPHHGSERNVDDDYFERIVAKHYLISADGKFSNPDIGTLEMISAARPDDGFTIHLTYPTDGFNDDAVGKAVEKFFAKEKKKGRKYEVETREAEALSLRVELA